MDSYIIFHYKNTSYENIIKSSETHDFFNKNHVLF